MDKIQKDNAEPGKAPDKMSADKLHLFATQYAFILDVLPPSLLKQQLSAVCHGMQELCETN